MKRKALFIVLTMLATICHAQEQWTKARQEIHDNILLTASNYVAYVDPTAADKFTPAPKGYEPFYLTHYGRHGSRWLINAYQYEDALGVLERAHENGKLTERGELLLTQLTEFYKTVNKRRGELTNVGERQHHRIGKRMTEHFPEIFGAQNCEVDARSTVVIRCILSMEAECEELMAYNKNISIHNDVSESLQYYLNHEPWEQRINDANKEKWNQVTFDYTHEYLHPERFWNVIINDSNYRDEKLSSRTTMMKRVFDIASNMQSHGSVPGLQKADPTLSLKHQSPALNLYDLFTEDECYNLWRCKNIEWYINYSSGISPFTQLELLKNFISTADTIMDANERTSGKYHGATLRFGHEVCVMPMAALLELGDCYPEVPMQGIDTLDHVWANYRIFPMASNIQLAFYRPKGKKNGDILVKAMLNEREVSLPGRPVEGLYYKWDDLRKYYCQKIQDYEGK